MHHRRFSSLFASHERTFSLAAAVFVTLVGALSLTGWTLDVERLKTVSAGITMKPNAALSLLLAGASLWILVADPDRVWTRRVAEIAAGIVALIGMLTLSEHLVGWDLGIDQLLFSEEAGAIATTSPGRMGPPASICFTLAGLALLLFHEQRGFAVAQSFAIVIALFALLAIIGYTYRANALYTLAGYTGIALHTALALFMLSLGLLSARSDRGITAVISGPLAGSVMARRLLIFAIGAPFLLGWLRIQGQLAGYYDLRFGTALLVLTIIVLMCAVIWRSAVHFNHMEQRRLTAEAARLHEIETMMEVLPIGLMIMQESQATRIVGNKMARDFLRVDRGTDANLSLSAPPGEAPAHFRVLRDGMEVSPDTLPLQQVARDGVAMHNVELDIVFDDGTIKHELISALPLLGPDGTTRGAVASLMDITELRRAERDREELLAREQEARVQAEAANRAKDQFLATVSHELRTPLNAILGWATLLRERVAHPASFDEALATIERNCRMQAKLIEDLLDVSSITAGKLRLDVKPVDLTLLIRAACAAIEPAAAAKGIQVQMTLPTAFVRVLGDPTRLQQIVWNLLTNAVKFTPRDGHVAITVEVAAKEANIIVRDTGEGISAEFMPYVFDRFRQADGTKTRRHGGIGLGLAIARHLVEMHGGTIDVASDGLGTGATFAVRLPLLSLEPARQFDSQPVPV